MGKDLLRYRNTGQTISFGDINEALGITRVTLRTIGNNNNSAYQALTYRLVSTPYFNRVSPKMSHWYNYYERPTAWRGKDESCVISGQQYMSYIITNAGFTSSRLGVNNDTWVLDKTIYGNIVDFTTYTNYYTAGPAIGSVVYNDSALTTVFPGNDLYYQYSIIYNSIRYISIMKISSTGVVLDINDVEVDQPRKTSFVNLSTNVVRISWDIPASKLSMLTNTTKAGSPLLGYMIYKFVPGAPDIVYVETLPTTTLSYDVTVLNINLQNATPPVIYIFGYYNDGVSYLNYGCNSVYFSDTTTYVSGY